VAAIHKRHPALEKGLVKRRPGSAGRGAAGKNADQDYSYSDAVSLFVIEAEGIPEAVIFDQRFETIGIRRITDSH